MDLELLADEVVVDENYDELVCFLQFQGHYDFAEVLVDVWPVGLFQHQIAEDVHDVLVVGLQQSPQSVHQVTLLHQQVSNAVLLVSIDQVVDQLQQTLPHLMSALLQGQHIDQVVVVYPINKFGGHFDQLEHYPHHLQTLSQCLFTPAI